MALDRTSYLAQLVDLLTPDTTNTRIGVANASPTRTLDVTGTFGASGASTLGKEQIEAMTKSSKSL